MRQIGRLNRILAGMVFGSIMFVLLFTGSLNTFAELKIFFNRIIYANDEFRKVFSLPNAGMGAMPVAALEIREALFRYADIEQYSLSPALKNDEFIYQRIVEGCWPVKYNASASFVFVHKSDLGKYSGKKMMIQGEEIALVSDN
jgi:hypothetical protein